VIRRADIALVGVGMLALGGSVVLMVRDPMDTGDLFLLVLLLVGLATAGPFLARIPGAVLHGVLVWTALLGAAATLQRGAATLTRVLPEPSLRPMVEIVLLVALVLVLGPGRSALGAAVDWLLFRQSRRRAAQLQGIVHAISPEIGMTAVCEEALAGFVGILGLRGAALIFRDGQAVVHGDLEIGPVLRIWPRDTALDALAAETFDDLPPRLRRELAGTDVAGLLPVVGPRRRWGHLMVSMPALSAPYSDEELRAAVGFANALALVLDAAELVARAATVERSLAHAEKLAVLGEFAARIVHDVRNPVTAARSFAQRLARAPAGGTDAEAATLILSELERVERYMAALLRFARRDEIRPEAVDLGALAQSTVKACRPRLEADGISVTVEAMDLVTVRADPEKLRQVLANIVENAADALQSSPERRLVVSVAKANGTATLGVTDSGPGVTESEIDRLFEPFFTTKTHGTGLGLAIAQRTVEAHGGRIVAARAPSGGMSFRVELPLAGLADGRA
jgi:signal transduction histidine kinase